MTHVKEKEEGEEECFCLKCVCPRKKCVHYSFLLILNYSQEDCSCECDTSNIIKCLWIC